MTIYRIHAKLFLPDGSHTLSKEGTTQGDNCASWFYSISTLGIIKDLGLIEGCKQIWYADDGSDGGRLTALKTWLDRLTHTGPPAFPNAGKTWLAVKPEHKEEAISLFDETRIKITDDAPCMDNAIDILEQPWV